MILTYSKGISPSRSATIYYVEVSCMMTYVLGGEGNPLVINQEEVEDWTYVCKSGVCGAGLNRNME